MIDLKQIQNLRETKGKEQETLDLIFQAMSEAAGDPSMLVTLNWEASLVYQHEVMNEVANPTDQQNEQIISEAKSNMAAHANAAHELIQQAGLDDKLALSHRFLGRVADYSGKYEEAANHYIEALTRLPQDSPSRLEISGFLAYSKTMSGLVDEGMMIARKTYKSYFDTDLGKNLKEKDYFVWAVWMSGIAPRQLKALQEVGADYDAEEMKSWLLESKYELENPSGKVTWGDDKFAFRIDELDKALAAF